MENQYTIRLCGYARTNEIHPLDDTVNYYDLTFVMSGTLHYIIDGTEIVLNAKDGILIPPGSKRVRLASYTSTQYFYINFMTDQSFDIPLYMENCLPDLKDIVNMHISNLRRRSDEYYEEKQLLTLRLMLVTLQELAHKHSQSPHVNMILQYISQHFTEKITLKDIAQSVFLTVPYCCNLVKKELNTTIHEIIMRERLLLAQDYIKAGEKPLSDIPYLCGFNDYNHFSKSFKKFTGTLPSRYKKLHP